MLRALVVLTVLLAVGTGVVNNVSEAAGAQRRARVLRSIRAATAAYVRAMPVLPSSERIVLLDKFVRSIEGVLPKLDLLYLTAGHDESSMAINLVGPGRFTLTPVNNPVFVPDSGVRGGGEPGNPAALKYYDTNFSPANDAQRMTVDNAEIGVFVLSNEWLADNPSPAEAGNDYSLIKALETVLISGTPTTVGGRISRNATARTSVGEITTAVGLTSVSRDEHSVTTGYSCPEGSATRVCIFKNGVSEGGSGGAPVVLGEHSFWIGAVNAGVNTNAGYSIRRVGAYYAGATLSNSERVVLYDALIDYLTEVGAYDPASGVGEKYQPPAADPYAPPATAVWTKAFAGTPLDLSGYTLTFDDEFASTSTITVDGGGGPWSAPVHTRVGFADFGLPTDDPSPFSVTNGILQMRMMQDAEEEHGWQAGHMQTANSQGQGFSQRYGYFEARIRMPPTGTRGAWSAFWLYSQALLTDPSQTRAEVDVIEYYPGANADGHHSAVHLRPGNPYRVGEVSQPWFDGEYNKPTGLNDGQWHTHGALLTPQWIVIYFDGAEQKRFPMLPEFAVPMFLLVSMQGLDQERQDAVSPIDMFVDYVRVYQAP
jgi:beta-glucanase (GH16 family)